MTRSGDCDTDDFLCADRLDGCRCTITLSAETGLVDTETQSLENYAIHQTTKDEHDDRCCQEIRCDWGTSLG